MIERDIFTAALQITDPGERAAYLDLACTGNSPLRRRIEVLLRAQDEVGGFLETPVQLLPSTSEDATMQIDPADANESTDHADRASDLSFLQPSTKPGSLGRLGHYEVLELLGRGGFGIVVKAFDETLHRVVAVKVMAPELAATSPPRKRFLREAQSAAGIRNENVVTIYAVEEQPLPYLVMEYVAGETLQQRLDRIGPLHVPEVLRIGQQIALGLAAAHALGLIHRDIKPANILLENGIEQHVKISDFGLARAADDASLTQSGLIAGTPMYMAPEQALDAPIDQRTDLFSLGSVLYVACSGRPPFRASTTLAVLKRVTDDTPRPIREINPDIPEWLAALISRLHAKKPEDRFGSAKEVADLLAHYRSELPAHGQIRPVTETPPQSSPAVKPARSRLKHGLTAAAVVLLLLAGFGLTEVLGVTNVRGQVQRLFSPEVAQVRDKPEPLPVTPEPTPRKPAPRAVAPFNATEARGHQEAWAKELGQPVETTNALGMKMILLPPGEFLMGSTPEEVKRCCADLKETDNLSRRYQSELPRHQVTLTMPFRMSATEVTIGQFRQFIETAKYSTTAEQNSNGWGHIDGKLAEDPRFIWSYNYDLPKSDTYPVCNVTWEDAAAFCAWLSRHTSREYRLPTEAEWEYACRAGTQTTYYFGDDAAQARPFEWCKEEFYQNTPVRHNRPVAQKRPNPFGLYDMLGNVEEYCADLFALDAYRPAPVADPQGPTESKNGNRLMRTSMSRHDFPYGRCADRKPATIDSPRYYIGFRVVMVGDLFEKK